MVAGLGLGMLLGLGLGCGITVRLDCRVRVMGRVAVNDEVAGGTGVKVDTLTDIVVTNGKG